VIETIVGAEAVMDIAEPAAQELIKRVETVDVNVNGDSLPTTFARFSAAAKNKPKLVCLHGFDSSCLEFRRLAPLLTEYEVLVPDILGWGFSPLLDAAEQDFSPKAKMDHLSAFVKQISDGKPVAVLGASLGGALAITLAVDNPKLVDKVILLDAQGFIDGKGPSDLPKPLARLGVNVLKSTPLRMFANFIAYSNKKLATVDAMKIGRLHCLTDTWEDASVNFLLSGGFVVSDLVKQVSQDTLILWGRQDEILPPETVGMFQEALPKAEVIYVEDCGHVPHLEQPSFTADAIRSFLK
jgi:pimeloyl-ACP methyl ester carboxylesterase